MSSNWYLRLEILVLLLVLIGLGIAEYSRITLEQQREIELITGLEQLSQLEAAYFREHNRYFDPTDAFLGLEWNWIDVYHWDVEVREAAYRIDVRADLDGDGKVGIWRIGHEEPGVRTLVED